jgi:hypothetical protein
MVVLNEMAGHIERADSIRPTESRERMKLAAVIAGLLLVLVMSLTILAQILGFSLGNKTVYLSRQPQGFCSLRVVRQRQSLNYRYILLVSRHEDPDYGFTLDFPENVQTGQPLITQVQWGTQGITLTFPSQVTLFIPERNYSHGR